MTTHTPHIPPQQALPKTTKPAIKAGFVLQDVRQSCQSSNYFIEDLKAIEEFRSVI